MRKLRRIRKQWAKKSYKTLASFEYFRNSLNDSKGQRTVNVLELLLKKEMKQFPFEVLSHHIPMELRE